MISRRNKLARRNIDADPERSHNILRNDDRREQAKEEHKGRNNQLYQTQTKTQTNANGSNFILDDNSNCFNIQVHEGSMLNLPHNLSTLDHKVKSAD